jgi:hypothetical protein
MLPLFEMIYQQGLGSEGTLFLNGIVNLVVWLIWPFDRLMALSGAEGFVWLISLIGFI